MLIRTILRSYNSCLVQTEVDERRAFLKEMKNLGLSKKYATIIEAEISQVNTARLLKLRFEFLFIILDHAVNPN